MKEILDYIFDWLPFGLGVPILIGIGFGLLADEFKAFKAARVCFYLATAWIYGKVFMWAYLTSDKFLVRAVVAFLVFGFVGIGLIETLRLTSHRETKTTKPPPLEPSVSKPEPPSALPIAPTLPPIERTVKFAVMVPFDTAPDSFPVPFDENPDNPLFKTYSDLHSLARNGTVPATAREAKTDGQISWHSKSISMEEAPPFLGKLLQYYVFHYIDELQRNSLTVSVGYPAQARAGIEPPNAQPYPYEKLFRELADNVFFRPFLYRPSSDEMAWKLKPVSMPKGTEIRFIQIEKPNSYLVRLHRPDHFKVDFIVESFAGTGIGQAPKNFVTPHINTTMQWTFFITMHYIVQHPNDDGFNPNSYAQWLDALYDGLHKRLAAD